MNSKQRRKARRQGKNIPYFDGFNSREEWIANQNSFLLLKREKWLKQQEAIKLALFGKRRNK